MSKLDYSLHNARFIHHSTLSSLPPIGPASEELKYKSSIDSFTCVYRKSLGLAAHLAIGAPDHTADQAGVRSLAPYLCSRRSSIRTEVSQLAHIARETPSLGLQFFSTIFCTPKNYPAVTDQPSIRMKFHGLIILVAITLASAQQPKRHGKHEHVPDLRKSCDCPKPDCPVFLKAQSVWPFQ